MGRGVERFLDAFEGADEVQRGARAAHRLVGGDHDVAVHLAVVFEGVELAVVLRGSVDAVDPEEAADHAAGFGALERHGDFLALVHLGPRHGEVHRLAGLERDEAVRGGLDVGRAFDDIGNAPRALKRFVVDVVVVGAREDVRGLGVAHEVEPEVDHVEEVDERAAAGEAFCREPAAEAGDTGAANPFGLTTVDGADGAGGDVVHHRVALGAGAVVEIEHQRLLRFFGGRLHDGHFLGAKGGGLFAENVFAGVERLEGEGGVEFVGNDDRDGVELGELFQHLGDVGVDAGDVVLGGGAVGGGLVNVAEADDLGPGLAETGGVIAGHAAGSDDGDFGAHVF